MNNLLNSPVRSQADAFCQTFTGAGIANCRSGSLSIFSRREEVDADFFSPAGLVCCGEELKPLWSDDGRLVSLCRKCGQKYIDKTQVRYGGSPWIGVDLDGTLARDIGANGLDEIGSPIKPMLNRVKKWIADGKTVKIFTARASSARQVARVKKWLARHGLPDLEVTNTKDLRMVELWDDRCVQVTTNLGEPVNKESEFKNKPCSVRDHDGRQKSFSGFVYRLKILLAI
jgi:hypothetical protein